MTITLSENLKKLRRERGNTQSELAAHLGLSSPAISKWEKGESYPDIELLPAIALYYGVSVDDLLGVGAMRQRERIEAHLKRDLEFRHEGLIDEAIAACREALREFPNEPRIMFALAGALFMLAAREDSFAALKDEIVSLCERVAAFPLEENRDSVYNAIQMLCLMHGKMADYGHEGERELARKYAEMMPNYYVTQNELKPNALAGQAALDQISANIWVLTSILSANLGKYVGNGMRDPRLAIEYHTRQIKLHDLFHGDDNSGASYYETSHAYLSLAVNYARVGEYASALDALERAVDCAGRYDAREDNPLTTKNYVGSMREMILSKIENDVYNWEKGLFDPLRADPRYAALLGLVP
jgi:transcriptional regulator with XRE-family HTH domain